MALREILLWPHTTLKNVSAAVRPEDLVAGVYDQLILDLFDTMYEAGGVGLSAIQVEVPYRIFVMDVTNKDWVFVNPVLSELAGGQELKNEGCLSLPGIFEQVKRWNKVTVKALDRNGKEFQHTFEGMEAQCCQHEAEHLDGVTMPDHFGFVMKERMRKHMLLLAGKKRK